MCCMGMYKCWSVELLWHTCTNSISQLINARTALIRHSSNTNTSISCTTLTHHLTITFTSFLTFCKNAQQTLPVMILLSLTSIYDVVNPREEAYTSSEKWTGTPKHSRLYGKHEFLFKFSNANISVISDSDAELFALRSSGS